MFKNETENKPIARQGRKLPQYIAALTVCLGSIASGTVWGWTGNIIGELKNKKFNNIEIDDFDIKWIGSCAPLGAMIMCLLIGIICEKLGRKLSLLILAVVLFGGWLFIIFANSAVMIYVGRIITGMGGGGFYIAAPLYSSEIAEKEIRGALVTIATFIPFGVMVAYIIAYVANPEIYTIIVAVLPLLFAFAFIFQPETPVYSMKQGREAEARNALIRLRGNSYDVDAELKEIKKAIEENPEVKISFKESMKKRSTKKAATICFSLMFLQQASGINAVVYYISNIFESSGTNLDPKISTVIVGVIQVISTYVTSLIVDKLGRKPLLSISYIFMAIGLIILGVFYTLSERWLVPPHTLKSLGFMPLLGLLLYMVAFPLGCGIIPWLLPAELFPPEIKGVASAAVGTFNRFMTFLITNFYFDIKQAVGGDITFYIFSIVCVFTAIFVFPVVPETKGKSFYQIQKELSGKKGQFERNEGRELDS
ncbi:hypothetical protein ILUMI_22917 [Ignelater luminosus]|uniref:Major facilitator superfamily (MFS) profile domain-containing protein n=1 Tax=Ignelater luminosus TaxID=2038154 RepID=A0A8K0CDE6_IGNLU|nr:hypothetical protein ILUMI_22917 [Ignelater luminosus]